jgi:hypothetical protein
MIDVQISGTNIENGCNLEQFERNKRLKYEDKVSSVGYQFIAATFDTFGNMSTNTDKLWKGLFDQQSHILEQDDKSHLMKVGKPFKYWATLNGFVISKHCAEQSIRLSKPLVNFAPEDWDLDEHMETEVNSRVVRRGASASFVSRGSHKASSREQR